MVTRVRPQEPSLINFNEAIGYCEDALRHIFTILKDPRLSLVCQFWHAINSSCKTYEQILMMYNQQAFMTRFTIEFPLKTEAENIDRVRGVFNYVRDLVEYAGIKGSVKLVRETKHLGPLELNPVMKIVEEAALVHFFERLDGKIPKIHNMVGDRHLKAKYIRIWMQDNSQELQTITGLDINQPIEEKGDRFYVLPPEISRLVNLQHFSFTEYSRSIGYNGLFSDAEGCHIAILPPDIGLLVHLQRLNINGLKLRVLPPEMDKLVNLQVLNLKDNRLKDLPSTFGQLSNLKQLILVGNRFTKVPPVIYQMIQLTHLDFEGSSRVEYYLDGRPPKRHDNQLTVLSSEIGKLTNLVKLILRGNQLTVLPSEIGQLTKLRELHLSDNKFRKEPSEIDLLTNLQYLNLDGNPFWESWTQ